ncbi:MAG: PDZ domain-containing protein, partial [Verrucomicrobia bacterium]|nr:PDZ domain-containing protein [Cytophagales bacterium]
VNENSAAKQAGLRTGDVIVRINNNILNSTSELQAFVATFRPGDKILVSYEREGKLLTTSVLLKNIAGQTVVSKKSNLVGNMVMGAVLQAISDYEKEKLSLSHGVKIIKLSAGKIKEAAFKEDFIITHIDHKAVSSPEEVVILLQKAKSALLVEGIYPDGSKDYRAIAP